MFPLISVAFWLSYGAVPSRRAMGRLGREEGGPVAAAYVVCMSGLGRTSDAAQPRR
jgi:hypothetical protein